jgi:hypothetical protein
MNSSTQNKDKLGAYVKNLCLAKSVVQNHSETKRFCEARENCNEQYTRVRSKQLKKKKRTDSFPLTALKKCVMNNQMNQ